MCALGAWAIPRTLVESVSDRRFDDDVDLAECFVRSTEVEPSTKRPPAILHSFLQRTTQPDHNRGCKLGRDALSYSRDQQFRSSGVPYELFPHRQPTSAHFLFRVVPLFSRLLIRSPKSYFLVLLNLLCFSWRRSDMSFATFIEYLRDASTVDQCEAFIRRKTLMQ